MNIQQVQQIVQALFRPSSQEEKTQMRAKMLTKEIKVLNFMILKVK